MKPVQLETMEESQVCEGLRLMWKELKCIRDIDATSDEPKKN
jgi:hypothetical protein